MIPKDHAHHQRTLPNGLHHRRRHQVQIAQGNRAHFGSSCAGLVSHTGQGRTRSRFAGIAAARREPAARRVRPPRWLPGLIAGRGCRPRWPSGPAAGSAKHSRACAKTIRDHVKEISQRRFAQTLGRDNEGGLRGNPRDGITPLPSPNPRVTGSAVDVVALASPSQHFFGDRKRHVISGIIRQIFRYRNRCLRATVRAPPCLRPAVGLNAGRYRSRFRPAA